jgi:hypothetical protein
VLFDFWFKNSVSLPPPWSLCPHCSSTRGWKRGVPPCPWCQTRHPKLPSWAWRHNVMFIFYIHVCIK